MKEASKKTKASDKLDRLAARLRKALQGDTKNFIEVGDILIEIREHHFEHGEWQSWIAENFDLSYRTALRHIKSAEYAASKGKSDRLSLLNLSRTVLYGLAEGRFGEQEEAAILAAARKGRVDERMAQAICKTFAPPDEEEDEDADQGDEKGGETVAEEDPESEAILDGPPPAVPPPAPNVEPPNFALRAFDEAVGELKKLATKPAVEFDGTAHSDIDLQHVEEFIRTVREKRAKEKR